MKHRSSSITATQLLYNNSFPRPANVKKPLLEAVSKHKNGLRAARDSLQGACDHDEAGVWRGSYSQEDS